MFQENFIDTKIGISFFIKIKELILIYPFGRFHRFKYNHLIQ